MNVYQCLNCGRIIKDDHRENPKVCIKCTSGLIDSLSPPKNDRELTKEEIKFVEDQFTDEDKLGFQVLQAFNEKFGWFPNSSTINKYNTRLLDET